jgi:hypothetical protein
MRCVTFIYAGNTGTLNWEADEDLVLVGWRSWMDAVVSFDPDLTYGSFTGLPEGVYDSLQLLLQGQYVVGQPSYTGSAENLFFQIPKGQKIYVTSGDTAATLVQLFFASSTDLFK